MLGLGNWEFTVDTLFFRGKVTVAVSDKNGAYDVVLDVPGVDKMPPIEIITIEAEGNDLFGTAKNEALGGKEIPFRISFDGDKASGFLKIPFMGKLVLNDGKRIS